MSYEGGLNSLVEQIREASANLTAGDVKTNQRIDELTQSVNEIYRRQGRPGAEITREDYASASRKDARELCILKHDLDVPKNEGQGPAYEPTSAEVDAAMLHKKALRNLFRHGNVERLHDLERKSLTSFSFGGNSFVVAPEMSNRVLSCIVEPDDVTGLVDQQTISAPSIRFPIDNARMTMAAWACEASCFANNPQPDLAEGLGQLEIKSETSRYVVCAGADLLQDSSFDVQSWIFSKGE